MLRVQRLRAQRFRG